jgi:Fe-S cluster assembly ATP-binding protein
MNPLLSIANVHAFVAEKAVLNGINLAIEPGQTHAIMGPNGSGKSSLANTLMGHPRYTITQGEITFDGQVINTMSPDKRAKAGIFLAMQHPVAIEGLPLKDFLRQAYNALYDGTPKQLRLKEFASHLQTKMALLKVDQAFVDRPLNVGFSGGEKKRAEMLQLAVLQPKLAILDEIDSGLDVDALKTVCQALNTVREDNPAMAVLVITHYNRILQYLNPDVVHVLDHGAIVRTGGPELAETVEQTGYDS